MYNIIHYGIRVSESVCCISAYSVRPKVLPRPAPLLTVHGLCPLIGHLNIGDGVSGLNLNQQSFSTFTLPRRRLVKFKVLLVEYMISTTW